MPYDIEKHAFFKNLLAAATQKNVGDIHIPAKVKVSTAQCFGEVGHTVQGRSIFIEASYLAANVFDEDTHELAGIDESIFLILESGHVELTFSITVPDYQMEPRMGYLSFIPIGDEPDRPDVNFEAATLAEVIANMADLSKWLETAEHAEITAITLIHQLVMDSWKKKHLRLVAS